MNEVNASVHLVVRFQHLHPSCRSCVYNCWNLKNHEQPFNQVELMNLTFENELSRNRDLQDSNVKFAPRERFQKAAAQLFGKQARPSKQTGAIPG
jgi:hypothetical protein